MVGGSSSAVRSPAPATPIAIWMIANASKREMSAILRKRVLRIKSTLRLSDYIMGGLVWILHSGLQSG